MSGRSAAEGGLLPLQVTLNCRRCLIWCVVFQRSFYVLSAGSGPGDRATPSASPSHLSCAPAQNTLPASETQEARMKKNPLYVHCTAVRVSFPWSKHVKGSK